MFTTTTRRVKAADRADAIPQGFDPIRYPIIATHFLGINTRAQPIHREAEKLHALGPRPYGELLAEIGEQRRCRTFIEMRLREYAAIPPETLRELDDERKTKPIESAMGSERSVDRGVRRRHQRLHDQRSDRLAAYPDFGSDVRGLPPELAHSGHHPER